MYEKLDLEPLVYTSSVGRQHLHSLKVAPGSWFYQLHFAGTETDPVASLRLHQHQKALARLELRPAAPMCPLGPPWQAWALKPASWVQVMATCLSGCWILGS